MTGPVLDEQDGPVLTLTLHRPERLNAVSEPMYTALREQLARAGTDPTIRVVVLRGAGRAFCAGADLKAHAGSERTLADRRGYAELAGAAVTDLVGLPKPVLAVVHGYAFGAGAELATAADFLITTPETVFAFPELTLGTYVGGGVTMLLPQLVGLARARELLFTGRRFTGAEAAAWGLAHQAVASPELPAAVSDLTGRLADSAPVPTGLLKQQLNQPDQIGAAIAEEVSALTTCMGTADWREGLAAFAERRTPSFEGR
ncbi:enoyl-CoA hydratase/isomerase family protein [Natronosporangium hydrolyticum]|uniref:Enoyl-CoA hydratase/isomerase family protein n=1 Tax=Natronosporangium hydrolyticum TaxID=2811111 RepID=A0A895YHW2_9ACTN|nr:enoyl-CoA hydratase/isomerase family protein [Natronosporangium hydrolyticum]QSB15652.1 enoyl-CoA hydratase/isomerase family protein [Natronosporangium hydrolyticum]